MIEHRKLQVDTRKWIAARLCQRKYGDTAGRQPAPENNQQQKILVEGALQDEFGDK
jgi:hypothetical protein